LIDSSCRLGNTPEEEEEEEEASAKAGHIYPLPVSRTHGVSTAPIVPALGWTSIELCSTNKITR
jgi:hypothetical protein